jgi:hypothetical protein
VEAVHQRRLLRRLVQIGELGVDAGLDTLLDRENLIQLGHPAATVPRRRPPWQG